MKFNGSAVGKIFGALLCILLGMIIAIGGEVGAIYYVVTQFTVGKIAEKIEPSLPEGVTLEFSDEVKDMQVIAWGQTLIATVSDMDNSTIGQIEDLIGYAAISKALYEMVGVETEKVKAATMGTLGSTISEALTLGVIADKFGIALPDMPLFEDDEFMYETPISTAFEGLTAKPLNQFVKMDESETNIILLKLQDLTIDELGGEKLTETVNSIKLGEVIEIEEGVSNNVLVAMKDLTIGELGGEKTDEIINSMFMCEIVDIDDSSEGVMKAMKFATLESKKVELNKEQYDAEDATFRASEAYADALALEVDGYEYIYGEDGTAYVFVTENDEKVMSEDNLSYVCYETKLAGTGTERKNHPIVGINDTIKTTTIGQIMTIEEGSKPMWSLRNSTLDTISEDLNKLFLDEIMDITPDSSKTLLALRFAALKSDETLLSIDDVVVHSEPDKEMRGYAYVYAADGKGGYIPYVAIVGENGEIEREGTSYKVIKTKDYESYYRPLASLDSKIKEILIGELIDTPESQTLKSLTDCALENTFAYIPKTDLDATTALYENSNTDHALYERDGLIYKYSALGLAYVCVTDDDGDPIIEQKDAVDCYKLYATRFYDNKYYALRGLDDKVNSLVIGDVIEVDENSSSLLRSLRNTRVNQMDSAVNNMFMGEMMDISTDSAQVLQAIKYTALKESKTNIPKSDADTITLTATTDQTDKEVDGYTYFYIKDSKNRFVPYIAVIDDVTGLPKENDVGGVMHYEVYATKYLEAEGKNYPIVSLDSKLKGLKLSDVFSAETLSSGVLSLIPSDTKIDNIGTAVADVVKTSSLATLSGVGVLDSSSYDMSNMAKEQRAYIWNSNLNGMIQGLLGFVNNPITATVTAPFYAINYSSISPTVVTIDNSNAGYDGNDTVEFTSLTDFVATYAQNNTIELDGVNVTVAVDPTVDGAFYDADNNLYYIPVFNLSEAQAAHTLSFSGGTVVLAMYKGGVVANGLAEQQYYYAFDSSNASVGSGLSYYAGNATVASAISVTTSGVSAQTFMEYKRTSDPVTP